MTSLIIKEYIDQDSSSLTYLVYDEASKDCILIDPVLKYDQASSTFFKSQLNLIEKFIIEKKLSLHAILETHVHADHFSGASVLKEKFPKAIIGINKNIALVSEYFTNFYKIKPFDLKNHFDVFLEDNQNLSFGTINLTTIFTPGHTPTCTCLLVNEKYLFTGDTLFMPDFGTGRCDFPNGSAEQLYHSITQRLYTLADSTVVYVGHDYCPEGRELKFSTTIGEQKNTNKHLKTNTSLNDFVDFRNSRDKTLSYPKLLLSCMQLNIKAGSIPDENIFLKIPTLIQD